MSADSLIIRVPMAGAEVGKAGEILFTVVGSCVAVMLYDKKKKIGGMAHIMLAHANGSKDNPSKYADTAVPYLLDLMQQHGANPQRLRGAKIAGGGVMFIIEEKTLNVSRENVDAVLEVLNRYDIQVIASDCGKNYGRRIHFDVTTGKVLVQSQGVPDKNL